MIKKYHEFIPKSFLFLRRYSLSFFKKDLHAGLTVGIVAVPLAMAFAIASGVDPERGLWTGIIAGFLISFLGGSRVQIGGPTGAFVVVVYSIVQRHGYDGLAMATLIAAVLLVLMGLFRLGSLIKYVPHPLTTGFTAGIAVVIFSSQMKDFFGLQIASVPADFLGKWNAYFHALSSWQGATLALAAGTLGLIFLVKRYLPSVPWGIFAIFAATAFCWAFPIPVDTISSRFGEMPRGLPMPTFDFAFSKFFTVFPDAVTIALLAGIESLLSAVIADGMTGGRHKSNCELVAQGIANFGSVIFGGIPATAAIARTATNIKTGAQTPMAGMIHAVSLFLIMYFFAPLVGKIPLAALASVLIVVCWNMSEVPHFIRLFKAPKGDVAILLTAFFLTVLVDLTVAVEVGMILAAFLFMKRMGEHEHVIVKEKGDPENGVAIFEVKGPLFFGVADRLKDAYQGLNAPPKIFILRMRHVPVLDATGMHALKELSRRCASENTKLVLWEVQAEPADLLRKFGLEGLMSEGGGKVVEGLENAGG